MCIRDRIISAGDNSLALISTVEAAIDKGMSELLGKSLDELADAADIADAKEEASRLKAEMDATKARAG